MGVTVRTAGAGDAEAVLALIQALADYERLEGPDKAARDRLRTGLFSDPERLCTLVAEVDGVIAGYAVAFEHYSTFEGLPKFYLEDILSMTSTVEREQARRCSGRWRKKLCVVGASRWSGRC